MARLMACSLTVDAVRDRSKTVTRRDPATWTRTKPGDRLVLVEKAQGIPKGGHVVRLAEVQIVDSCVEMLSAIWSPGECTNEGFPEWDYEALDGDPDQFIAMWLGSHGYRDLDWDVRSVTRRSTGERVTVDSVLCRRIEWRYLDGGAS